MGNLDLFRRDFVLSIKPEYANRIVDGSKTVELRRRFPSGIATGARMLVYASSPLQALIGHATILDVERRPVADIWRTYNGVASIDREDFDEYFRGLVEGCVIRLGSPVRLPAPIGLAELKAGCGFVPPQSFAYADEDLKRMARVG